MAHQYSAAVEQLIRDKMASGRYASEEELLVEALQSLAQSDEELRAVEEGLASADRGEAGVPLEVAFDNLRQKHRAQP
jgi:predicted transcriptional regulator